VGDVVSAFECAAAAGIGVPSTIAVGSASSAFELIMQDIGVGASDDVVVPVFGWMSVPGAVVHAGAELRLADVDQGLHCSWEAIRAALTPRTKAVIIVHMRGFPCSDVVRIAAECKERGLILIEDCAQAWGSTLGGRSVGTFGNYGVFSTQHYKLVVTGEGGVLIAADPAAEERLRWLSGRISGLNRSHPWPRNVRMAETVAATGILQIGRLPETMASLGALANEMSEVIRHGEGLRPQSLGAGEGSNGVSVPVWCTDDSVAQMLIETFSRHRVPAFRPGLGGDLHNALSWPVPQEETSSLRGLRRLASYVDLPVPLLRGRAKRCFLNRVGSAVAGI
jgi:dTDP-4-amino-4,6-dideoxygalactose transaminase